MNLSKRILNSGLYLSMEFGENWLVEINQRLSKKHPELTHSEIKQCAQQCKKVNNIAHDYVYNNPVKTEKTAQFADFPKFEKFMQTEYDWINEENLKRLYSQSCYYAWK